MSELPVLWSAWASSRLNEDHRQAVCGWLRRHEIDPSRVKGVEIVLLDLPCIRLHCPALDDEGSIYARGDEIAMAEPLLLPMRTPPPGYETEIPA